MLNMQARHRTRQMSAPPPAPGLLQRPSISMSGPLSFLSCSGSMLPKYVRVSSMAPSLIVHSA